MNINTDLSLTRNKITDLKEWFAKLESDINDDDIALVDKLHDIFTPLLKGTIPLTAAQIIEKHASPVEDRIVIPPPVVSYSPAPEVAAPANPF